MVGASGVAGDGDSGASVDDCRAWGERNAARGARNAREAGARRKMRRRSFMTASGAGRLEDEVTSKREGATLVH